MGSTVDKARIVFRLKCNGWVDGRGSEQPRRAAQDAAGAGSCQATAACTGSGGSGGTALPAAPAGTLRAGAPGHPAPLRQRGAWGKRGFSGAGGALAGLY